MGASRVYSILLTGCSGFVGRHLLRKLDPHKYKRVVCLGRSECAEYSALAGQANFKFIRGSLLEVERHERELAGVDTVVHMAAMTGKARPEDYFRVNVEGTRALIRVSQRLGVQRFLFISSIAASFPDKSRYYYAQSKEQAEELVRGSGLRFMILRPTIILGQGSPAGESLARLAEGAITMVLGNGRTRVQPIDVDDLVEFIFTVLDRDMFERETLELGGPEVITMEALLRKMHRLRHHREGRVLRIPLAPILPVLAILERVAYSALPLTVGQLSSFRYDGTIETNHLFQEKLAGLKTVDQMLAPFGPGRAV